ncbi:hypothetical protein MPSEU_001051600 [Mayamaea pseudoterrestris]|nr:hypothetical protein MPSEU_001051600 [Mayamaea pseudoterrestris]
MRHLVKQHCALILLTLWSATTIGATDYVRHAEARRLTILTAEPTTDTMAPSPSAPATISSALPSSASSSVDTWVPTSTNHPSYASFPTPVSIDTQIPGVTWSPTSSYSPSFQDNLHTRKWYSGSPDTSAGADGPKSMLTGDGGQDATAGLDSQPPATAVTDGSQIPSLAPTGITATLSPSTTPSLSSSSPTGAVIDEVLVVSPAPSQTTMPPSTIPEFPSSVPSNAPSNMPSLGWEGVLIAPSAALLEELSDAPSDIPSEVPSDVPSVEPSWKPSFAPSNVKTTIAPSDGPSSRPSDIPSVAPSVIVTVEINSLAPNSTSSSDEWCLAQINRNMYANVLQSKSVYTRFVKAIARHDGGSLTEHDSWRLFVDLPAVLKQVYVSLNDYAVTSQREKQESYSLACTSIAAALKVYAAPSVGPVSQVPIATLVPEARSEEKTANPTVQPTIRQVQIQSPSEYAIVSNFPTLQTPIENTNAPQSAAPNEAFEEPIASFGVTSSAGWRRTACSGGITILLAMTVNHLR